MSYFFCRLCCMSPDLTSQCFLLFVFEHCCLYYPCRVGSVLQVFCGLGIYFGLFLGCLELRRLWDVYVSCLNLYDSRNKHNLKYISIRSKLSYMNKVAQSSE